MGIIFPEDERVVVTNSINTEKASHAVLCNKAKDWLINAKRCNPVFIEKGMLEKPDAIGWNSDGCIVVECKTSVADYKADMHKPHRHSGGLGNYRYYLIAVDNEALIIPDNGWGLVIAHYDGRIAQKRGFGSKEFERNLIGEIDYLKGRIFNVQNYGR